MAWLYLVLALVLSAVVVGWMVYAIVRWILADAPPGTRFWGISNGPHRQEPPAGAGRAPTSTVRRVTSRTDVERKTGRHEVSRNGSSKR